MPPGSFFHCGSDPARLFEAFKCLEDSSFMFVFLKYKFINSSQLYFAYN